MKKHRLIGVAGLAGAGKSTVTKFLAAQLYATVNIADPIREMMLALGVPNANVYGTSEDKDKPLEILGGRSARYAMQTLGTEWGRNLMGEDFWTDRCSDSIRKLLGAGLNVAVDSLRFPSEVAMVRDLGGVIILVERDGLLTMDHPSENSVADLEPDIVISNNGTLRDLLATVQAIGDQ